MKIFKTLYLILLFHLVFALQIDAQTVKLKIIETTDEHGAAFPYDFTNQRPINGSLAQATTYLKEERAKKDQQVILLSGGDLLQGTPLVYYYNFEKTDSPHVWAEIMNFMKYDAGAVGNHDIETGHPVYDRFSSDLKFPWLAANAVYKKNGEQYFKPYTIIIRDGVKIAVLGMITPAIPNWLPPKIWDGMEFLDMIETADKWIKIIKEKEKPDLMIGLFHSGVEATYGGQKADSPKNENASLLIAESVPGFDIIFVGHDHHGWNYSVKSSGGKDVLILGGTSSGRDMAVANCVLTYNSEEKIWVKEITGEILESKIFAPDQEFMSKFSYAFDEVNKYVKRPIGNFTESISSSESLFGPSSFTDLIHSVQMDLTGADVSFTAPLSYNSKIEKGEITVGDMFNLYRYENLLYTMSLSGEEIKNYLEYSYKLWFNEMKSADDHLLNFQLDENGNLTFSGRNNIPVLKAPFYNFDCAAGINYSVDLSKPAGERINITALSNGSQFDLRKNYNVAVNSYRGNGGGGHLVEGAKIPKDDLAKRIITSTDKDLRYYMMKWIEQNKTIEPKLLNNWRIIPAGWWNKAKEKDGKLMFPNRAGAM
ncbi:MAG: bifunctional metallophosphatase/5'-nucleotidase [Ignavibacteriae bacterium HGW-Ignavibacteriae-3]|nr:MAG: bifunctional metallophosphatase/5'-nucleotidase [Ignavibacteriae bacterium HGW-Ignavibacteriae-3]